MEEASKDMEEELEKAESPGDQLAAVSKALSEMSKAFNEGETVEPVDFRELQEQMPRRIGRLERTVVRGETNNTFVHVSQAEAHYESADGDERLDLSIVDMGSMKDLTSMGFEWLGMTIDREGSDGYERTLAYEGYPAFTKFEHGGNDDVGSCQMIVYVAERFVVSAEGDGTEAKTCEEGIEEVDLSRLARMKDQGVIEE